MDQNDRDKLMANVRVIQIITLAMAMGVLAFGVVVLLVFKPEVAAEPMIACVAFALAIPLAIASFIVPKLVVKSQPATVESFQTGLIVGLALIEGAAFFNLVAYMLEGQIYSLVTAAILIALMLIRFPTVAGVSDWMEQRNRQQRENEAFRK